MPMYRKKPVVIHAIQWNGGNFSEINAFVPAERRHYRTSNETGDTLFIKTLGGELLANPGDYIIKGTVGEFYPCKPDIFAAIYEGPL